VCLCACATRARLGPGSGKCVDIRQNARDGSTLPGPTQTWRRARSLAWVRIVDPEVVVDLPPGVAITPAGTRSSDLIRLSFFSISSGVIARRPSLFSACFGQVSMCADLGRCPLVPLPGRLLPSSPERLACGHALARLPGSHGRADLPADPLSGSRGPQAQVGSCIPVHKERKSRQPQ
jgi:hypothetical protein